ncbi:MAG: amino acid permease [Gemmatimonadota bacterium]|nr:amino acid permease [Gemmatimonadota bacterium]
MALLKDSERLVKQLTLRDVFAISTGAMFSSGFFLLPGLAAAEAGPSVVLAYLLAGALVVPAMFSKAELTTAMPRAGGTYYFLDRSLGPLMGTVGGLGIWISLVLKSAFALIGIGAYTGLFMEIPMRTVAVGLTLVFTLFNVVGAKQTAGLQRVLVYVLLSVLAFFVVQGLFEVVELGFGEVLDRQFTPFMPFGLEGLAATTGLVFVSYAGLTKVSSVAEEVDDPDRNIPLGMLLSLATATFIYVVGVFVMVAVLDPVELRADLTPVATAAEAFFDWLPEPTGLVLVLAAAFAAFASTGNAGILSASRYPLAMARDGLMTAGLSKIGRFGTPTRSVLLTAGLMIAVLLFLDVKSVAKLASAFQLLIFSFVNLSVIVMRESELPSYVPGYRSPLYPWMQIAGILIPIWLILQLGTLSIVFTFGILAFGIVWYFAYSQDRVVREGAIYHVFERLGRRRYQGLEPELRQILKEKALGASEPFEEAVASSLVVELDEETTFFEEVVRVASARLAETVPRDAEDLAQDFLDEQRLGITPVSRGAALPHLRVEGTAEPRLVLLRSRSGATLDRETVADEAAEASGDRTPIHAFFFLVSPTEATGTHLHILAQIAAHVDAEGFMERWLGAEGPDGLKEVLLHEDRFLSFRLGGKGPSRRLVGVKVVDASFPPGVLLVLIERGGSAIVPEAETEFRAGDRLTFLGTEEKIEELRQEYRRS